MINKGIKIISHFLLLTITLLLVGELALRTRGDSVLIMHQTPCTESDPKELLNLRKNCSELTGNPLEKFLFTTNESGFRDRTKSFFNQGAIIVLGDSHVMGFRLPVEKALVRSLERKIVSDVQYPLLNIGMQSLGPTQEYLRAERALKEYKVKGAIWFVNPTDVADEIFYQTVIKFSAARRNRDDFFWFKVSKFLHEKSYLILKLCEYLYMQRPYVNLLAHKTFDPSIHCESYYNLHKEFKVKKIPLIFVSMNHGSKYAQADYRGLPIDKVAYEALLSCLKRTGRPLIDVRDSFDSKPELFWSGDWHLHEEGTEIFTKFLAPQIIEAFKK